VEGGGTASDAWNKVVSRIHSSDAWPAPGQSVIAYLITDSSGQPFILRLKNLGDNVIGWVLTLMGALTIGKAATGSAVGTAVNWFSGVASAANLWLNFLFVVGEISLGFFLMISIYIPLIPFIVFMGQILAWLLSVIEGVAAAPFLAFARFDTAALKAENANHPLASKEAVEAIVREKGPEALLDPEVIKKTYPDGVLPKGAVTPPNVILTVA
jgi:hypothetical protein